MRSAEIDVFSNKRNDAVQKETQEEIERLEGEISTIEEEMAELKKILYGRFGHAINLEE